MAANVAIHRPRFLSSWWPGASSLSPRLEFENFIDSFFGNGNLLEANAPPTDLAETNEAVEVRMNLPGVKSENINVEVNGNLLTISGKVEEEKEEKGKTYHRTERRTGQFLRSITLPCPVNEDKVKATCKEGVLCVVLPKTAEAKSRKITVTS